MYQLGQARKTAKALAGNLLPQFFLRRMKTLIAKQLPKKTDRIVFCPLTKTQAKGYQNFLDSPMVEYIRTASETCECGSSKKSGWCCKKELEGVKWQTYVFPSMQGLQKLSNHLALIIPRPTDMKEKQEKDLLLLKATLPDKWKEICRARGTLENFANSEFCGKWRVLRKLLKFWHDNGDKVLVFSHSVRLLEMLRMLFNNTNYNVSFLDGSVSYEDRANEVDNFNSDPNQFVFLLSTKAGGVGKSLTPPHSLHQT